MNRPRARHLISGCLLLLLATGATPAAAFQAGPRAAPPGWQLAAGEGSIPWNSLAREEQQLLKKHRGSWSGYPQERQRQLRDGARRYLALPPEERESVERERRQYEKLSPRQRQQLREEYRRQQR